MNLFKPSFKYRGLLLFFILITATSCEKKEPVPEDTDPPYEAGDLLIINSLKGPEVIRMRYCPGGTFPTNEYDKDLDMEDGPEVTVEPFWISETEVSNALVARSLSWAHGFYADGSGITGGTPLFNTEDRSSPYYLNENTVRYGDVELLTIGESNWVSSYIRWEGSLFFVADQKDEYPCVDISHFGAVMVCNWLTELGVGKEVSQKVYSGMDDDWLDEETVCEAGKKGFRLPTVDEWKCAARWRGTDALKDGIECPEGSGVYWSPGDYASGAKGNYLDYEATSAVAVYEYDQADVTDPEESSRADSDVLPNQLGLYHMSGNVWEWCQDHDPSGSNRLYIGGSYVYDSNELRIGNEPSTMWPGGTASDLGFRVVIRAVE